MANILNANPMVITGSMATAYKAALNAITSPTPEGVLRGLGTLRTLIIEKIYWFNPINVGDQVTIGDPQSGETLLNLRCEVANQSQLVDWTANPKIWTDFQIDVFSSGTLYIYTRMA